jgi:hypothetical protein
VLHCRQAGEGSPKIAELNPRAPSKNTKPKQAPIHAPTKKADTQPKKLPEAATSTRPKSPESSGPHEHLKHLHPNLCQLRHAHA